MVIVSFSSCLSFRNRRPQNSLKNWRSENYRLLYSQKISADKNVHAQWSANIQHHKTDMEGWAIRHSTWQVESGAWKSWEMAWLGIERIFYRVLPMVAITNTKKPIPTDLRNWWWWVKYLPWCCLSIWSVGCHPFLIPIKSNLDAVGRRVDSAQPGMQPK